MTTEFPSINLGQSGRFQMVRVTNRNAFALVDRFDGVPYEFRTNQPLSIAMEVATHILGWPAEPELMRLHIAKRTRTPTRFYARYKRTVRASQTHT